MRYPLLEHVRLPDIRSKIGQEFAGRRGFGRRVKARGDARMCVRRNRVQRLALTIMPHIVPPSALGQRTGAGTTRRDHWWCGLLSPGKVFSSGRELRPAEPSIRVVRQPASPPSLLDPSSSRNEPVGNVLNAALDHGVSLGCDVMAGNEDSHFSLTVGVCPRLRGPAVLRGVAFHEHRKSGSHPSPPGTLHPRR